MHRNFESTCRSLFCGIAMSIKCSRQFIVLMLFLRFILGTVLLGLPGCIGDKAISVEGVVTDENKKGIEGATLEFTCPERDLVAEIVHSHEEGSYFFQKVHYGATAPSKVTIVCSKEGYESQTLSRTLAERTEGLNIVLRSKGDGETVKDK